MAFCRVQGAVLATVQLATNSLLGNLERQIMSRSMTSSMDAVMDSANLELALTTSSTDFEDMSCSPRMRAHFIASSPRGRATGVSGIASPRLRGSPRAPAGQAGLRGKLLRLQIDSPRPGSPRLLGILDDEEDMISSPVLRAQWEEHISKGTAPLLRSKDEQVLRSSGGSARSSQLSPARKPTPTERVVVAEAWNECFSPEAGTAAFACRAAQHCSARVPGCPGGVCRSRVLLKGVCDLRCLLSRGPYSSTIQIVRATMRVALLVYQLFCCLQAAERRKPAPRPRMS